MNTIFKKLNYKNQALIHVIGAPASFYTALDEMKEFTRICKSLGKGPIHFILLFVKKQERLKTLVESLAPHLEGDALVWVAYPKKTSKQFKSDIHRDIAWEVMGQHDMEGVRIISIDEDWSALRFRKVDFIKTMKRKSRILTEKGHKKAEK